MLSLSFHNCLECTRPLSQQQGQSVRRPRSEPMIMKSLRKCIAFFLTSFSRPSPKISARMIGWVYLAHMAAACLYFLVYRLTNIYPMIRFISIEEVHLFDVMGCYTITQLFRIIHPSPCCR